MTFRVIAPLALSACLAAGGATAKPRDGYQEMRCFDAEQKARLLESKLRQGHSNDAGRRYKNELRRLRDFRRKFCRN